ncbi:MAG TPA: RraA family protein [Thermomicrobiaceae bacterium]|nr:RraA family protein [Thermomicrobiaceae bacterium]
MEELIERLARSDTAAVADAQSGFGILDPEIRSVVPGVKVAGPAFTVKCYPGSIITVHKALLEARPGDVLVIDGEADGRGGALIGELMSREAMDRGIAGVVVDGAVRDAAGVRALGFPTYARQITPRVGVNRRLGQTQVSISVGGVVVHPGDVVLADDDGVAIIPRADLERLVEAVEAIEQKETGLAEAIGRHERLSDLLGLIDAIRGR